MPNINRVIGAATVLAVVSATAVASPRPPTDSSVPAGNGLIAYTHVAYPWQDSDWTRPHVMTIKPDGTYNRMVVPPDESFTGGTAGPRWSADGRKLLLTRYATPENANESGLVRALWYSTPSGQRLKRIPLGLGRVQLAGYDWAPDGRHLVVAASRVRYPPRLPRLYSIAIDGTHRKSLHRTGWWPSWSGDGRYVVYNDATSSSYPASTGIALVRPDGKGFKMLTRSRSQQSVESPTFSPDGQRVIYVRNIESSESYGWRAEWRTIDVTGRNDVVVRTLDAFTRFRYCAPQWRPDGKRLAAVRREPAPNDTETSTMVTVDPGSGEEHVAFRFPFAPASVCQFSWQPLP